MRPSGSVERTRDELQTARVVVEQEGCQTDGRVRKRGHVCGRVPIRRRSRRACRRQTQLLIASFSHRRKVRTAPARRPGTPVDVGRNHARHVGVNAKQFRRRLHAQHVGDDRAPIATLRDEVRVAKAPHQRGPGMRDPFRPPAGRGRLAGEPVAGHRRDHDMEGVRCASAVAVGLVSGSMILSCSMTEPGHPCVTISGKAFSCLERTWMKWMSSPSISVMKFG